MRTLFEMPRCFIGLGGNLGSVEQTFHEALAALEVDRAVTVVERSAWHKTKPVGDKAGSEFVNGVAELSTEIGPSELLARLQEIESQFGRTREVRWGPRPLDLDLVLYGDRLIDSPQLRVPHPGCWYRRFVLDPMIQIASEVVHPEKRVTFGELQSRLLARPLPVALAGATLQDRTGLRTRLQAEFPDVQLQLWEPSLRADQPVLLFRLGGAASSDPPFEQLPLLPRLDASTAAEGAEAFIRHALQAALG